MKEVFEVTTDRWDSPVPANQIILDSLVGVLPAVSSCHEDVSAGWGSRT